MGTPREFNVTIHETGDVVFAPKRVSVGHASGGTTRACDPTHIRCGRRSTRRLRLYAGFNDLRYMWTLTYREPHFDWHEVTDDVARLLRSSNRRWGRHPYAAVKEPHKSHGLHVHLLLGTRRPVDEMEQLWTHGFVGVTEMKGTWGYSAGEVGAYYVAKHFKEPDEFFEARGVHRPAKARRFAAAQGFAPSSETLTVGSRAEADELLLQRWGMAPSWRACGPRKDYTGPLFWIGKVRPVEPGDDSGAPAA